MNNLDKLMNELNKKYKQEIISHGTSRVYNERIPFGSPRLNYMTYGGIPIGKSTEFIGAEGSAKTTTAIDIVSQAQKMARREYEEEFTQIDERLTLLREKNNKSDQDEIKKLQARFDTLKEKGPKKIAYIDAENTLDEDWARLNGVDTEELILVRPQMQTAENVLQMVLDLIDTDEILLVIIDSIPMLVPQQIYDEDMDKKMYAGISGPLTMFSARVSSRLSKYRVALLSINQPREDFDNPFEQWHTPGGRAWKHLHSLRLGFRKGKFINENNEELTNSQSTEPAGNIVDVTIVKTKICKPNRRTGNYTINYMTGIDIISDTVDLAVKLGYIQQSGAWFYILDGEGETAKDNDETELKFQGRAKLLNFLRDRDEIFEELYEGLYQAVRQE